MKTHIPILSALILSLVNPSQAEAVKLSNVFTDHMVLQRERPTPIWGRADAGAQVTVEFAGQKKTTKAGADGKWLLKLDPLPASAEGRELSVRADGDSEKASVTDVVVGDVWLCSGQSNMHFRMQGVEKAAEEIAAAKHPSVRFFTVTHQFSQSPLDELGGTWRAVSPDSAADCSAVAYFFGVALQQKLDIPIGLVLSSVGGTRIESWMRAETLAATGESKALVEKWQGVTEAEFRKIEAEYSAFQHQRDREHPQAVKDAKAKGKPAPPAPIQPKQRCHDCPSSLHNGMIAPLHPLAIRGAIWYQGESNAGQAASYEKLLPAMISDWRKVWGEEMPFFFVQIAPHSSIHPSFREAQQRIWENTPHTAMAVTTDVGNEFNIHPLKKRPVGERLALAARALSYGEDVEYSGPVFEKMSVDGSRAVLSFTHHGKGLMAKGDHLTGFTIAGADGKFLPASAVINGQTIVVTSDKVTQPSAVRYGWATMPDGNLFNKDGLPAPPFRTDQPQVKP